MDGGYLLLRLILFLYKSSHGSRPIVVQRGLMPSSPGRKPVPTRNSERAVMIDFRLLIRRSQNLHDRRPPYSGPLAQLDRETRAALQIEIVFLRHQVNAYGWCFRHLLLWPAVILL